MNRKPPPLQKLVKTFPGLNERIAFQKSGRENRSHKNTKRFLLRVLFYPRKGVDNNNKIQPYL